MFADLSLVPLMGMDLDSPRQPDTSETGSARPAVPLPFASLLNGSGCDLLGIVFGSEEFDHGVAAIVRHLGVVATDAGGALWGARLMTTACPPRAPRLRRARSARLGAPDCSAPTAEKSDPGVGRRRRP